VKLSKREKNKKIKNEKIKFNRELHEVHNAKKSNQILICDNLCILLKEYIDTFLFIQNNFQIKKHCRQVHHPISLWLLFLKSQVLDRSKQVKLSMFLLPLFKVTK
jgi:hypothetical protein